MEMYRNTNGYNIEIDKFPFFAENIDSEEFYNRRDMVKTNIMGGTQHNNRGAYVARTFSFKSHIRVEPDHPDIYNDIFRELMSKNVSVVSPELGGMFDANVVIKPQHTTPSFLEVTVKVTEIPTEKSNIPGDTFIIPEDKLEDKTEEEKDKEKLEKEVNPKPDDKPSMTGELPRPSEDDDGTLYEKK